MTTHAYTIRVSSKAKHARIKLSAREGLVVVVPKGFDQTLVPRILEKKREWIRRTEERFELQRKFLSPKPVGKAPERIVLRVTGEEWWVDYRVTNAATVVAVERPSYRLLVYGDIENESAVKDALRRWVARKTHKHIAPWVMRLARERDFRVERLNVRSQRTRWASCSCRKIISLNLRLMFLPERLVRYVLLHELAHTKEMSHSRQFWALLSTACDDYHELHEELRTAWRIVPTWLGAVRDVQL